jgi:hypothetical protein
MGIAVDPRTSKWYGVRDRAAPVLLDFDNNAAISFEVKGDIAEMHWPRGVAFDTKRDRLLISTCHVSAYLYACDVTANRWSIVRDMKRVHLIAMAYSPDEDCIYALMSTIAKSEEMRLCRLDPDGNVTKEFDIQLPIQRRGAESWFTPPQLALAGHHVAVLTARPAARGGQQIAMDCMIVDINNGEITFSGELPRDGEVAAAAPAGKQAKLGVDDLAQRWRALRAAEVPATAKEMIDELSAQGDAAVATIAGDFPPALKPPDATRLQELVARLDHDDFKVREAAEADLIAIADLCEPELRAALESATSAERHQRLQLLLTRLKSFRDPAADDAQVDSAVRDPSLRGRLRAIRVLSRVGTPAAVRFLRQIAGGPVASLDVVRSRLALRRL